MKALILRNCKYFFYTTSIHSFIYSQSLSLLTDANFIMTPLNPTLFPGVSSSVLAHQGFLDAQAETAPQILAQVRSLLSQHNTNSLTLVSIEF